MMHLKKTFKKYKLNVTKILEKEVNTITPTGIFVAREDCMIVILTSGK